MSLLPELVGAPLVIVFVWFCGSWGNRQFQWMQRIFLGRTAPAPSRFMVWAFRCFALALAVLWVIGLVRRFG